MTVEQTRLNAIWRQIPFWRRPVYVFDIAFRTGMFWAEMLSAFVALLLIVPAFNDVGDWPLSDTVTRASLAFVFVAQSIQVVLARPYSRWSRIFSTTVASAWWCGVATIMFWLGVPSVGVIALALFLVCFLSLMNLSGAEL